MVGKFSLRKWQCNTKKTFVKPLQLGQWLCRQPSACLIWAAPPACSIPLPHQQWGRHRQQLQRDDATLPHYQRAAAAVWASGSSFSVSTVLLIYTYSLLPARALSKTLSFVLVACLLQTRDKVPYDSAICSRIMTTA